jgi:hypothetical protein
MVSIFLSRARLALIFLPREDKGCIRWDMCRVKARVEARLLFN